MYHQHCKGCSCCCRPSNSRVGIGTHKIHESILRCFHILLKALGRPLETMKWDDWMAMPMAPVVLKDKDRLVSTESALRIKWRRKKKAYRSRRRRGANSWRVVDSALSISIGKVVFVTYALAVILVPFSCINTASSRRYVAYRRRCG